MRRLKFFLPVVVVAALMVPKSAHAPTEYRKPVMRVPIQPTIVSRSENPMHLARVDSEENLAKLVTIFQPELNEETARNYVRSVISASTEFNIDRLWILSVIYQESKFRRVSVSDVGAIGLMQILPSTARAMGVDPNQLTNTDVNIHTGVKYLAYLRNRFGGDLRLATIAYNQGEGNVFRGTYLTWYYDSVNQHYQNMKLKLAEIAAQSVRVQPKWNNLLNRGRVLI